MSLEKHSAAEEARIQQLRNDLTSALRAKDAERVIQLFTDQPVMFLLPPPLQFTGESGPGKQGVQGWFDTFEGEIGYEIKDFKVVVGDEVAFCHSLNFLSGTQKGKITELWLRETLGLRLVDGEWKIAHQHQSVPFYMDGSGKAALDLQP